ncbi:spinster family MFS transporter [Sphingosinicella soli]|uniref:MFS family permease n=1 Tax=Sphingosinicella soli TaxID=333708 RepID=A0A7W7B467_9SPHN|nr:MFS transporter [Sphingosinicella soli]MBB4633701.1 MFS family permease [Sphingosinicella soli]
MNSSVETAPSGSAAPLSGGGVPGRYWVLAVMTMVYAINIADRFVLSTLIEPIKAEFALSDSAVGFLTGVALALFYTTAGLPLGALADRVNRRNMIAWAITIWSMFTALCGLAQNFWMLLLARIGVGVGEAGGTPPSHSILADYFRPSERVVAMSIYAVGVCIGSALGGIGGGLLAEHYGWRAALVIFACGSIPVLILLFTVREPRRGACDPRGEVQREKTNFRDSLRFIRSQRSLVHVLAGGTVATFSGGGLVWWTPAFLGRTHGLSVGEAGVQVGLMNGLGGSIAMIATIFLMLNLAKRDPKWQCHFAAWLTLIISVPAIAAHMVTGLGSATLLLWLFVPFVNVMIGPTLALIQNLSRPDMRGFTVAVLLFTANMANLAVAPQLIGFLSDMLATQIDDPVQSLRYALAFAGLTGIWGAWHFWAAIKWLPRDLERAGSA